MIALRTIVAAVLCALSLTPATAAERLVIGGSGGGLGLVRTIGERFQQHHPDITVDVLKSLGSSGGLRAVKANRIDLAVTAYPLAPEDAQDLDGAPFARTAMAFATADPALAGASLERRHVAALLTGAAVPPPLEGVQQLILRPPSDADTLFLEQTFPELAGDLRAAPSRPGALIATTAQEALDLVAKVKGSITLTSPTQIKTEGRKLRLLAFDGVAPSGATVQTGAYTLTRTFHYAHPKTTRPALRSFLEFVHSDEARALLAEVDAIGLPAPGP